MTGWASKGLPGIVGAKGLPCIGAISGVASKGFTAAPGAASNGFVAGLGGVAGNASKGLPEAPGDAFGET